MNYNQAGFNSLTSRRPYYLIKLLKKYKNVIYSDIDTIWMKDPRPYFKGNLDFWAQIDGVIEGSPYFDGYIPYICTGFIAIRSTKKSMKMLKNWHSKTKIQRQFFQDQDLLQIIAFEHSVNFGVLPLKNFPTGEIYFDKMPKENWENVVVVHNNYAVGKGHKIQRFKNFHLWVEDFKSSK